MKWMEWELPKSVVIVIGAVLIITGVLAMIAILVSFKDRPDDGLVLGGGLGSVGICGGIFIIVRSSLEF